MENDFFPWNQNPATYPADHHTMNCSPEMNFYNTSSNWDHQIDHHDPFESALSSMVSSPATSVTPAAVTGGGVQLIELIGKLGSVCSPRDISLNSLNIANNNKSGENSCYSTPLNSPPKLKLDQIMGQFPALSPLAADPGFAERAARFSRFGSRSFNGRNSGGQRLVNAPVTVNSTKLQGVSSCQLLRSHPDTTQPQDKKLPENLSDSKEESSVSQKVQSNEGISRKRKSTPRGKAKENQPSKAGVESNDPDSKRAKSNDNEKQSNENSKPPEPPKDYIHVRARRGQATDSHSLAERVRREKISERMKFLQDLVPGCNKVTGKAVMLDEIINYVQSLQQQVEFLSMKLATVNPRMDSVHMEALLSKEILQARANMYPMESSNSASAAFPYAYQLQEPNGTADSRFYNNQSVQLQSMSGFCSSASQVSMWEDELHNVVQMGFGAGLTEPSQMKMEP